ncbi:MAG: ComF family protein [Acidimicrobiia bacterium]|nr:ComF family protein [Acidimicrobiia bacterium]
MLARIVSSVFPLECPGCGRPGDPVCTDCLTRIVPAAIAPPPDGIDAWWAAFSYEGIAREVVARVKYRGAHAVTAWLAGAMVTHLAPPVPSVVTWVPTTPDRRRERGFDHAELLARQVGRRIARPTRRLLSRGPGLPQTGQAAAARRLGPTIAPRTIAPATVLLIDDVTTTGASLHAAAVALQSAGAVRIVALTAARTPLPSRSSAGAPRAGRDLGTRL